MRKIYTNSLLLLTVLSFTLMSCNDDGLSANDIAGIYTAKKIGQSDTFPLTIYNTRFNGVQVEAQWINSLQSIPVELTDDGFTINTEVSSSPIFGTATIKNGVITISYSINSGNSITMVASR